MARPHPAGSRRRVRPWSAGARGSAAPRWRRIHGHRVRRGRVPPSTARCAPASTVFPQIPPEYADMVGYTVAFAVLVAGLNIDHRPDPDEGDPGRHVADSRPGPRRVFGGVEAILIISVVIVILDTYFGTAGSLWKGSRPRLPDDDQPGAWTARRSAQFLINTTVPFVLARPRSAAAEGRQSRHDAYRDPGCSVPDPIQGARSGLHRLPRPAGRQGTSVRARRLARDRC